MKTSLLLSALAVLAATSANAATTEVTLDDAIIRAQQHAPELAQANGAVRTADAAKLTAIGAWLPTLSASAGSSLGGHGVDPTVGTSAADAPLAVGSSTPSLNGGVSASIDLFSGGRTLAQGRAAQAQFEAANAQLISQKALVTLNVTRAFSDEERAEALLGVASSRVDRAQQEMDAATKRAQVGNATKSDQLRAQLELNTAKDAQSQAQTELHSARFALGKLIGVDGEADAKSLGPVQPQPLSIGHDQLIDELVTSAPVVRAAVAAQNAADASMASAHAAYLPSLKLNASYDVSTHAVGQSNLSNGWSVGLGLSFPIFDGFKREESVVRADVAQTVAQSQLDAVKLSIRSDVEKALGQLDLTQSRIGFAEQALATAQEDMRVQDERYRLGVSTMLDLLTSQSALVQAETNAVTTRFDYQVARAQVEALAGRPL